MNRRDFLLKSGAAASLGLLVKGPLFAQTPVSSSSTASPARPPAWQPEFKTLRRHVGYYTGRGGAIGWLGSPDAVVAVDTQFPDSAAVFLKELPGRNGRTLDAVINTHHHGDHTGGNGTFRPATKTIVAQANVPDLMRSVAARAPKPLTEEELKVILPDATFAEAWHKDFGDETISARYFGPAHTKGDVVVLFEKANVAHVGDLVFNRRYPVIDRPAGANIRHWVEVLEKVVATYPKDTIYLFGHTNEKFPTTGAAADVLVFRDYLSALLAHVEGELKAGRTKEEILKLENLAGFPDFHLPRGRDNRFPASLTAAYEELTST
jgi:glyoxylase-like metal-dependent hydrolase (beta-lactamase superfamily II)